MMPVLSTPTFMAPGRRSLLKKRPDKKRATELLYKKIQVYILAGFPIEKHIKSSKNHSENLTCFHQKLSFSMATEPFLKNPDANIIRN